MLWFPVQLFPETFLIISRMERYVVKMCIGLRLNYPLFSSDFNES